MKKTLASLLSTEKRLSAKKAQTTQTLQTRAEILRAIRNIIQKIKQKRE